MKNDKEDLVRISDWAHFFVRNGIMAFFNSISLGLAFVSEETGSLILDFFKEPKSKQNAEKELGFDVVNLLFNEGIIVFNNFKKEEDYFNGICQNLLHNVTLELMYIIVTDGCDLCCNYCFEDSPELNKPFRPTNMKRETAKLAIDLFSKMTAKYGSLEKKKVIHLYGGEPLLNYKVVKFAISYIQSLKREKVLPDNCQIAIITNGTFLSDKIAAFFFENDVTVGLSIDGPKDINNIHRFSKKKDFDVFKASKRALDILKKNKNKVGLSVTLTPESVSNFQSVLDFLTEEVGWVDGLSLNILHFNPKMEIPPGYYEKAAECQLIAFERFRDLKIYEDRIMRKAEAFISQNLIFSDCGVVGNQLVIAPDGRIGVCQDFIKPRTYFNGSVLDTDFDPIHSGLFNDWKTRSPFFMKDCLKCEAIGICGGGCPASAELKTGNRWNIDERICPHGKKTLEWLIWETYAKMS